MTQSNKDATVSMSLAMSDITTPATSIPKRRLFLVLFLVGMAGVLSLLQAPFVLPADSELPLSPTMLRLLGLGQSAILVALAVLIGLLTAHKVGLHAPLVEATISRQPWWPVLQTQLGPAVLGAGLGLLVLAIYGLLQPILMPELLVAAAGQTTPLLTRVLYGGITEELLLRWGMMSFLVWLLWRLAQQGQGMPRPALLWLGNSLSAILFGLGHLPAITLYGVALTPAIVAAVVLGNAAVGLIYGWLYWRKGLEAAMLAHAGTHLLAVLVLTPLLTP